MTTFIIRVGRAGFQDLVRRAHCGRGHRQSVSPDIAVAPGCGYDHRESRETLGRGWTMRYAPPIAMLAFVLGMLLSIAHQAGGL